MNIELIMACVTLYGGLNIFFGILKQGSPEQALKQKIQKLEKFKESIENRSAYVAAYLIGLAIGAILIAVSLLWFIPYFN